MGRDENFKELNVNRKLSPKTNAKLEALVNDMTDHVENRCPIARSCPRYEYEVRNRETFLHEKQLHLQYFFAIPEFHLVMKYRKTRSKVPEGINTDANCRVNNFWVEDYTTMKLEGMRQVKLECFECEGFNQKMRYFIIQLVRSAFGDCVLGKGKLISIILAYMGLRLS